MKKCVTFEVDTRESLVEVLRCQLFGCCNGRRARNEVLDAKRCQMA